MSDFTEFVNGIETHHVYRMYYQTSSLVEKAVEEIMIRHFLPLSLPK